MLYLTLEKGAQAQLKEYFLRRMTMKQKILAKMQLNPGRIVLSMVATIFMLVLTFACSGG